MYSETTKEIKSYRNSALQFSQPAEIHVSNSLSLSLECSKYEGFWALLSRAESRATYISTAAKISLLLNLYTKNKEES